MNELEKIIYELELSLLQQEVRMSVEKLNALIAFDFVEYGNSGQIYDKKDILERLPMGPAITYHLDDFQCIQLADNIIQTRFKTVRINVDNTTTTSLRTSLWRKNNDDWQMIFHQGTPIE
jgi:hypothetical protein